MNILKSQHADLIITAVTNFFLVAKIFASHHAKHYVVIFPF